MTFEEKFMFDLEGYLMVKNVLTPEEVAELNAIADEVFPPDDDDPQANARRREDRPGTPATPAGSTAGGLPIRRLSTTPGLCLTWSNSSAPSSGWTAPTASS